jgi:hypothetical protein
MGNAPISYQGGTGIYHEETNSLRILTGYPNYDEIFQTKFNLFTYEYFVESLSWNPTAPRLNEAILYQSTSFLLPNEMVIVHGGISIENSTSCFQNNFMVLDLGIILNN